ncbi:MAG: hypothetical protein AB7P97_22015 [Hyphomonadaceae bacterium]
MNDELTAEIAALRKDLDDAEGAIDRLQAENTSFRAAMKACEDCGPNDPVWIDGEPANLEAAAADALEWLHFFIGRPVGLIYSSAKRDQLSAAISALERFLPRYKSRLDGDQ